MAHPGPEPAPLSHNPASILVRTEPIRLLHSNGCMLVCTTNSRKLASRLQSCDLQRVARLSSHFDGISHVPISFYIMWRWLVRMSGIVLVAILVELTRHHQPVIF